ncbi:MAG: Type 1 glutamine amidotransferase-like domain-containing protein [Clostridia bacterium]|nr:Type 1 glutamine amidotransferase-like domain-containing protein [Clostridia bacterium]
MRVFLCGGGSGIQTEEAYKRFSDLIEDKTMPLLYIPLAMYESNMEGCYEWITEELKEYCIDNIEMVRDFKELEEMDLEEYSAIFIGGGNTYKLLFELKLTGFYEKLKEYINNNGIVFAGSAGAIILGKDIKSCNLDDDNEVGLVDTKGIDVLNGYSVLCHYTNRDEEKNEDNRRYLLELSKEIKIIALPEEDTMFISDSGIEVYGDKPYYIFDNENILVIK